MICMNRNNFVGVFRMVYWCHNIFVVHVCACVCSVVCVASLLVLCFYQHVTPCVNTCPRITEISQCCLKKPMMTIHLTFMHYANARSSLEHREYNNSSWHHFWYWPLWIPVWSDKCPNQFLYYIIYSYLCQIICGNVRTNVSCADTCLNTLIHILYSSHLLMFYNS